MNKPLTAEEAKQLTFPCLLEVWDDERCNSLYVVEGFIKNKFLTLAHGSWHNAALPSPEIAEAMRKQFAPKSECPKRMSVWDIVHSFYKDDFQNEPNQIAQEIAELRQRLADIEAKHNQQS